MCDSSCVFASMISAYMREMFECVTKLSAVKIESSNYIRIFGFSIPASSERQTEASEEEAHIDIDGKRRRMAASVIWNISHWGISMLLLGMLCLSENIFCSCLTSQSPIKKQNIDIAFGQNGSNEFYVWIIFRAGSHVLWFLQFGCCSGDSFNFREKKIKSFVENFQNVEHGTRLLNGTPMNNGKSHW